MKQLLTLLWWVAVVGCQQNPLNYYTSTMTVTGEMAGGTQRIPRIPDPVVILALNELSYNTYFSLAIAQDIANFGDYQMLSLKVKVGNLTIDALIYKVTVQFAVLKDLPFLQLYRINLTLSQTSRTISSLKKIVYDKGVTLCAFVIGFSDVNLTTEIYYYSDRGSINYTLYTKSNLTVNDWLLVDLIILNESPDERLTCQGSYITTIVKVNNKSTPFYFERRSNLKYIFGIEAAYLSTGDISYGPNQLTVIISGRSLFDFSAVVLNVDCQQKEFTVSSAPVVSIVREKVFIALTIVFGTLLGLLLLAVGLFFCFVWRKLEWKTDQTLRSSIDKPAEKPIVDERAPVEHPGEEDLQSDTRITQKSSPRKQYQRKKPSVSTASANAACRYPTCSNNPDAVSTPATLHLQKPCQQCLRASLARCNAAV